MQKFIKLGNYIFNLDQVVLVTLFDELGGEPAGGVGSPATTISFTGDSTINFITVMDPAEREALRQILSAAGVFDSGGLVEKIRAKQAIQPQQTPPGEQGQAGV
jgi:hypothetical protein